MKKLRVAGALAMMLALTIGCKGLGKGIAIDETNFPDPKFRTYVLDNVDTDRNEKLSEEECRAVHELLLIGAGYTDLTGIGYFVELRNLNCSGNELTSLDLSNNTSLFTLYCTDNQLAELDISNQESLYSVYCYNNQIKRIDASNDRGLQALFCYNNPLKELNVTGDESLEILNCQNGELTSLDVFDNKALHSLGCHDNQLISLDVSNNRALASLDCENNQLTSLDVSMNKNLSALSCDEDLLDSLVLPEKTVLRVNGYVTPLVDKEHFPDDAFCAYVAKTVDKNGDGLLSPTEVRSTVSIKVPEMGIRDLTGIEFFTNLQELDVHRNELKKLDVTKNRNLIWLRFCYNQVEEIDLTLNHELRELYCVGNGLKWLNTSWNTELQELYCDSNQLGHLDVTDNKKLRELHCSGNQIRKVDVSDCYRLKELFCGYNKLTELLVRNHMELKYLRCENNAIEMLDLSQTPELYSLHCEGNPIRTLDLSKCKPNMDLVADASVEVYFGKNSSDPVKPSKPGDEAEDIAIDAAHFPDASFREQVAKLCDADGNSVLSAEERYAVTELKLNYVIDIDIVGMEIRDLTGIEHFPNLRVLDVALNELTSLDISKNAALEELDCRHNHLKTLDLSGNPALRELNCEDNELTSLDVSKCAPGIAVIADTGVECDNGDGSI